MIKYQARPRVIEAMRTDGTVQTANTIREWSEDSLLDHWIAQGVVAFYVPTAKGPGVLANPGDWIVRDIKYNTYSVFTDLDFQNRYMKIPEGLS